MNYMMLDGNTAAAEAIKMARVKVIASYPITPQTTIPETLAEMVESGSLDARYVRVESEHTALSVVTCAAMAGSRASTATASNGLALMHEVVGMTAGNRVPIVMPVVNRGIAAPWTLWCEHVDTMCERDMGWLQFYCQNVQEVLDLTLMAFRICEDARVLLPAMVCLDGFFLSHSMQKVAMPDQELVDRFIGEFKNKNVYLDPKDPMFLCDLTGNEEYTEMRYQQKLALDQSVGVIEEVFGEFEKTFGRKYEVVEGYMTQDADAVLVALGSMCGTAKYVVNKMRKEGKRVGLAKMTTFRPFPAEQVRRIVGKTPVVGVFDRSAGLGGEGGPVWYEVCAALRGKSCEVYHYVGGIGGRDVRVETLEKIYDELLALGSGTSKQHTEWIDVKDNALEMREVVKNV
ncbi:MAG: pyruvate ferredoxin oxidoreductase [Christensenellales bacterium]